MGLFTRKADSKAELESMKADLRSMRERLDAADAAKAKLAERVGKLDAQNKRLTSEVASVDTKVGTVEGSTASARSLDELRSEIGNDVARLDGLTAQIEHLGALLDEQRTSASEARTASFPAPSGPAMNQLAAQLAELSALIGEQRTQIADVALVATDAAERTTAAETKIAGFDRTPARHADDEIRQQVGQLAEKVASMDSRIHQVSLELTNQLTELSGELDASASRNGAVDSDAIIAEIEGLMAARIDSHVVDITGGQERLAAEQARHAISFRQELADLADRLRRPTTH